MDPDFIAMGIPQLRITGVVSASPSECCMETIDYLLFGYTVTPSIHGYIAIAGSWLEFTTAFVLTGGSWAEATDIYLQQGASWKVPQ